MISFYATFSLFVRKICFSYYRSIKRAKTILCDMNGSSEKHIAEKIKEARRSLIRCWRRRRKIANCLIELDFIRLDFRNFFFLRHFHLARLLMRLFMAKIYCQWAVEWIYDATRWWRRKIICFFIPQTLNVWQFSEFLINFFSPLEMMKNLCQIHKRLLMALAACYPLQPQSTSRKFPLTYSTRTRDSLKLQVRVARLAIAPKSRSLSAAM